jgi:hypothetical protein
MMGAKFFQRGGSMSKKSKQDKKSRPLPKPNRQIPNSAIRPLQQFRQSPYLQNARQYPLYGCWVMNGWEEAGITPVVVARTYENDRIMFACYMVDMYCLGIKDAYTRVDYSKDRFKRDLPMFCANDPVACSVEFAHEIVYGALEYAKKLGFDPHPDFYKHKADLMLDPPDAHPRENNITFGKDGKPLYIAGPKDSKMKSRFVVDTLMRTCGQGNFDYIIGLGAMM